MNTPRALLIPAFLALLTACGGGGDDAPPEPPPVLLYEGTGAWADTAPDERAARSITFRPTPAVTLSTGYRGRECVTGTWTQQATRAGQFRLQMQAESFAVRLVSGSYTVFATATQPGPVVVPFAFCGDGESTFPNNSRSAALTITASSLGGNMIGAYSVTARWSIEGRRL